MAVEDAKSLKQQQMEQSYLQQFYLTEKLKANYGNLSPKNKQKKPLIPPVVEISRMQLIN